MRLPILGPALGIGLVLMASHARQASACGGCFGPPTIQQGNSSVVTGHRMALATSPTRTVLWDQIQYSGDPKEFAWVLPVGKGAVLEASTAAWFETLDSATTAQITSPLITCPNVVTPQAGCSASQAFAGAADEGGGGGSAGSNVTIVHQGTVGPYETVTLESDKADALTNWLTGHGYNIDKDIEPIIAAYVSEGFDFIALRLLPNQGVRAMKPVRVVTPGASPVLPLRMVAAGTGVDVAITLFTITEGRLNAKDFRNEQVLGSDLTWDFSASTSDYTKVRKGILAQNEGFTWITAYAQQGALLSPVVQNDLGYAPGYGYGNGVGYLDNIAAAYVNQGITDNEGTDTSCVAALSAAAQSTQIVDDPCPLGASIGDPSCTAAADPEKLDARTLACGKLDDVAAALVGLHPSSVWLTRLEADLPRHALAHDLTLQPSADQGSVSNYLQATKSLHTEGLCPDNIAPLSLVPAVNVKRGGPGPGALLGYGLVGLAMAGAFGRRLTRKAARARASRQH